MFLLTEPDEQFIEQFLEKVRRQTFSYAEVGASLSGAPDGYNVDHNRIKIGSGADDFQKAVAAVKNWVMFEMPWVKLCRTNTPIVAGETVAALIYHLGFWSLNASRIVYVIDEQGEIERYGFAYGTLEDHGECGEERFSVEFHHTNGEVWYDLFAFSKPAHLLAKIGYPLTRSLQKQFAVESTTAMQKATETRA